MKKIKMSKSFNQELKKLTRGGKFPKAELNGIIAALMEDSPLPKSARPHKLKEKTLQGLDGWECHIKYDLVLIYAIDTKSNTIYVDGVGTHSNKF